MAASNPRRVRRLRGRNGLEVVHQAAPANAVSFSVTFLGPAGWGFEPRGSPGLARLTLQLLLCGTNRLTRVELARELDRSGATITRQCDPESAETTLWGPVDRWRPLMRLFGEIVLEPRFRDDDLTRVKRQMREHLLEARTQPAHRAERELLHEIFPARHPYRDRGLGTEPALDRLSAGSVRRFHSTHYVASGGLVVVTANVPPSRVEETVRQSFRFDETSPPRAPALPQVRVGGKESRILVPMSRRSQVEIRIGGVSLPRRSPLYPALYLANEVLGGRPLLARLFQKVRERAGLAYHADSDVESMRWSGYWTARAGTGAERWRKTVPLVAKEVSRIAEELVPRSELDRIRESVIGELALQCETTSAAHDLALDVAYYDLADDHYLQWPAVLRSLRPGDLRTAAEEGFSRGRRVTVVAGPIDGPARSPS